MAKNQIGAKEKKEEIHRLRETSRLFADLVNQIPDVIYFKDRKGRLTFVNLAHARGLGLKPEQVVGKTDFDIFPKERAQLMRKDDELVMGRATPIIDKIERATRPDGLDNYVSTTKIPRFDQKGNCIGLIGITRDITRRMQAEYLTQEKTRLQKKIEALEEVSRLKSEFISIVSHELRTPLAVVKEAISILRDGLAGPITSKQAHILKKGLDNTLRLNRLIEDLLDISRIESGTFRLRYALVNLGDLIKESEEFFVNTAKAKGIRLEYALPRKELNIFIDPERVNQVISNLVNNAIKFTEEGGTIRIEAVLLESKVRIGVLDTGVGIAKEDTTKLFEKFVQVTKIPGAERKGLGLGLSIARELVKKHGGEIWVESTPGVGSKFYFTIPRFLAESALKKEELQKINTFLNKGIRLHFINVSVVNYESFGEKAFKDKRLLFEAFRQHVISILFQLDWLKQKKPEVLITHPSGNNYSIIVPDAGESQVTKLCALLKEKINRYFANRGLTQLFVSVGLLSYPQKDLPDVPKELSANVSIKQILIGPELRRQERVRYEVNVDILSEDKIFNSRTIDITTRGLCFSCSVPLETDALVRVKFSSPKSSTHGLVKGRVAWLAKSDAKDARQARYKIGLEFISLNKSDRQIIQQLLKNISYCR